MPDDDSPKPSIWERDLLDNPVGRFFGRFVFPLTAFALGVAIAGTVLSNVDVRRLADCTLISSSLMMLSYGCMWVFAKTIRPSTREGKRRQERAVRISIATSIVLLGLTLVFRIADSYVEVLRGSP